MGSNLSDALLMTCSCRARGSDSDEDDIISDELFPYILREVVLTPSQRTSVYGLKADAIPDRLRWEVRFFCQWSQDDVQLSRLGPYCKPVHANTIGNQTMCILAFLGFLNMHQQVGMESLTLRSYLCPDLIVEFVSFLKARGVGRDHVTKHLSVGKKVVAYLKAQASAESRTRLCEHADKVTEWISTLQLQTSNDRQWASSRPKHVPDFPVITNWAEQLGSKALERREQELSRAKKMTCQTARQIQAAAIAMLLCGCAAPPIRSSIIKTAVHPDFQDKISCCPDQSCRRGPPCRGNTFRLEKVIPPETEAKILGRNQGEVCCACGFV